MRSLRDYIEIVGPRRVSTNPIDKINYQHTLAYGAYRALPDVIVRIESDPKGNHKVAEVLKFANEHKIPDRRQRRRRHGHQFAASRAASCSTCLEWTRS